ncbi:MAG: cytochrome c biogenesis protein/redoxin [Clostridiaceae bacterium]|nr:cytochrome c biogenesis protein/redoxin [Clostridiaceae bacterium]
MNLTTQGGVSALTILAQGLISFFSPCVFPIIPLFLGYLSGSSNLDTEYEGKRKSRLLLNTFFFILGISFAFFLLGLGFTSFGQFFNENSGLISKIGGVIITLFGIYQLGLFGQSKFLSREARLPFSMEKASASPLTAALMGFTFSFGWTPCVGPALASALLMASSAQSSAQGFALIGIYTLGFTLPFLIVALFAEKLLDLFSKKGHIVTIAQKIGAVLMIIMGVLMLTGYFTPASASAPSDASESSDSQEEERNKVSAPEITLKDRDGNEHSLEDYKGKTVFLNFWATWCGPCKSEMPDIQKLYENYGSNEDDIVIISIACPNYYKETSQQKIEKFLDENEYTYPVLFDADAATLEAYGVSSFPTTYMIDDDGNIFGYVQGSMSYETMVDIIKQTIEKDYRN